MKRFVNGVEVEWPASGAEVRAGDGRLLVRTPDGTQSAVAVRDGDSVLVSYLGRQFKVERNSSRRARSGSSTESGELFAPMPGQIVDVLVKKGDRVVHRQKLIVLEAMKTQQAFTAPFDGEVVELAAQPGQQVKEGDRLASIKAQEPAD